MNGALIPFFCFIASWKYFTMDHDCRFSSFGLVDGTDGPYVDGVVVSSVRRAGCFRNRFFDRTEKALLWFESANAAVLPVRPCRFP